MPRFKYVATDPDGEQLVGVVKGSSVEGVTDSLASQGIQVQTVQPESRSILQLELTPRKVKPVELANFSRQMAAFITAGLPLIEALAIIEEESPSKTLRKVVREVADSLRFGESFAEAMSAHADAFPPFYMAVLRSAEATGELDVVMRQLARYIERDMEAKRKIRSALAYPTLVFAMSLVTVGVLTVFVLPRFKVFFESFDAELPLATRMLIRATDWFSSSWVYLVLLVVAVVVGVIAALRTERGRMLRDRFLLRTPVLGDVVRFTVVERFCRVLTSMLEAGVPIPDALRLASTGSNNLVFERSLDVARREMLEGDGIARPIARTKLFPVTVTSMMRVGEETGTLDDQLEVVATYFESELQYKLKRLTNLFEPLAVVFVGIFVGFVAIALISAVYGIYNQVDIR
ncbi:MAG TPA: type II secretion system F family protein [Acidimicrobiales bacterium]|jgi:type IV pilus assembly protein PilC|nr:type II secretion system F family protein [Acidimicrobiales bacterium]